MVNWGFIGTGGMAGIMAVAMKKLSNCQISAVVGTNQAKAKTFADNFRIPFYTDQISQVLQMPQIDLIYVATQHPFHFQIAKAALQNNKHVLCEKPMTMRPEENVELNTIAKANNVLLLEGYMYRFHPQTKLLVDLLQQNVIGQVHTIVCGYSGCTAFNPQFRLFNPAVGGGSIWDVGGYPVSSVGLIMAALNNNTPQAPLQMAAAGILAENGVDINSSLTLIYPNQIIARLNCGALAREENKLTIYGTEGRLIVPEPWMYNRTEPRNGHIIKISSNGEEEIFQTAATQTSFTAEADQISQYLSGNHADLLQFPVMTPAESMIQNTILADWVKAVGGITADKCQG